MGYFVYVLTALAAFLTLLFSSFIFGLHSSDAAGNGLAAAYTAIDLILLWLALAVLLLVCAARGGFPGLTGWVMVPLFLIGAATDFAALMLATEYKSAPGLTLIQIAAIIVPALLIIRVLYIIIPPFQRLMSANLITAIVAVFFFAAAAVPWPLFVRHSVERQKAIETAHERDKTLVVDLEKQKADRQAADLEAINNTPETADLQDVLKFTFDNPDNIRDAAWQKISTLTRHQEQIEQYLAANDNINVFYKLPELNLKMTPALCTGARKNALPIIERFHPFPNNKTLDQNRQWDILFYAHTFHWMLRNGCNCTPEIAQIEAAILQFDDTPDRAAFLAKISAWKNELPK